MPVTASSFLRLLDEKSGKILSASNSSADGTGVDFFSVGGGVNRDAEGIVYVPSLKTVFYLW